MFLLSLGRGILKTVVLPVDSSHTNELWEPRDRLSVSCLSWKWRKRSSVKITERTHKEATEALHAGREGCHSEAAFGGRSADLGFV